MTQEVASVKHAELRNINRKASEVAMKFELHCQHKLECYNHQLRKCAIKLETKNKDYCYCIGEVLPKNVHL